MQSTQQNKALSAVYSTSPVYAKVLPSEPKAKGIDRSFLIACGLGTATVIFGLAAMIYQFMPEFERLKDASSQGEMPKIGTLQG
jgi:hypothetical protein